MANVLLWLGIALIVMGWLALAWQAAKWMSAKEEFERFPEKKRMLMLRRTYSRVTILVGILFVIIALLM